MKIVYSGEFLKHYQKLPQEIHKLFHKQEIIFRDNWRDSRLHVKRLKEQPCPFSFRITRNYRVLFIFVEDSVVLFATIGHRSRSYKK